MKVWIAALSLLSTVAFGQPEGSKFKEAITGETLPEFDPAYDSLQQYYGDLLPSPIYVGYTQGPISAFKGPNVVVLSLRDLMDDEQRVPTVTHEASHLGTLQLTQGQSAENAFRFIDEGFASIWQFNANVDGYKGYTMGVAQKYAAMGKVSFALVQDWRTYFGSSPDQFDYNAYNVGSSFCFFVIDRFGEAGFKRLLVALGNEKDLGKALGNALGLTLADAEAKWLAYIGAAQSR